MKSIITFLICLKILKVISQENAGTNVAPALIECYNKTANLHRDNRPETTMIQLIELITKIESSSSLQNDRELSKEIIHRFKQDGISKQKDVLGSKYTIPYSPMDYQADKNRLLLKVLIPGSAVLFPNETLNELERCSLHFMVSTSIDTTKRDDEAITCKRFAKYVRRIRRDVDPKHEIEIFDPERTQPTKRNTVEGNVESRKDAISENTSDCPIENGVVYTKWGAVASGTVIAGIAAGRAQQDIVHRGRTINNIYASTLAGDLAEVALQQGSRGKDPVIVGASGGWNAIEIPRAFYLEGSEKGTNYEMTDAEIRGGLDGLIIGLNMKEWHSKVQSLKISQVLDMYYSPRGVFSKKYRACNRNRLFTEVAPLEKLKEQVVGFSFMLSEKTVLPGTISEEGIEAHSKQAADVLLDYTANKLSDISCAVDDGSIERISTDIIIAIDSGWDYGVIYKILSYILQNLDINKCDSKYTIINGKDGSIVVETTYFLGDLTTKFTKDRHYMSPKGSDVDKVMDVVESMIKNRMDSDKDSKKAGGPSYILLFIKYDSLTDSDKLRIDSRKPRIHSSLPDLKILALGRGSKDAYSELVHNPTYDCFGLSENAIMESVKPVIERIRQTPRRIINPNCGSNWVGEASSSEVFDQYVEPYGINFYRVASNYLFGEGTKTIKIKGYGYGNLLACTSRTNSRPLNATQGSVQCETITANQEVAFKVENPCSGYTTPMDCAPVFFSVQTQVSGSESTTFRCTESSCRFPDNVKYGIAVDGLGCDSAANTIIPRNISFLVVVFVVFKLTS